MTHRKRIAARLILTLSAIACGLFALKSVRGQGFGGNLRSHDHSTTSQGGNLGNIRATSATVTGRLRVSSAAIVNDGVAPGIKVGGGAVDATRLLDISTGTTQIFVVGAGQGVVASTQVTISGSSLTVGGNAFSVGSSTLVVTGGNVGIGTASPGTRLHMSSGTLTVDGTGASVFLGVPGANMRTAAILAINGSVNADACRAVDEASSEVAQIDHDGANAIFQSSFLGTSNGSGVRIGYTTTGAVNTDGIVISNAGNVGIGLAAAARRLDVNGAAKVTGAFDVGGGSVSIRGGGVSGLYVERGIALGAEDAIATTDRFSISLIARSIDGASQNANCVGLLSSTSSGELTWTSTVTANAAGVPAILLENLAGGASCVAGGYCKFIYSGATRASVNTAIAVGSVLATSTTRCQGGAGTIGTNTNCRTLAAESGNVTVVLCGVD